MKKILLSILTFSGVIASAQIADVSISSSINSVSVGDSAIITIDSSQIGFDYYLRDNSNNSIIDGPISGTDSSLTFNTGAITGSIAYNVLAKDQGYLFNIPFSSGYVDFTDDTRNIDEEVTVAAWIKENSGFGLRNVVMDYAGAGADAGYILRITAAGKVSIDGRDGTTNYKTSGVSVTDITDNQWHYVVGTIDLNSGGFWKIYVDGVLESSNNYGPGVSLTTSSVLSIGRVFSTSSSYRGKLRDVTIWNTALDSATIVSNMSNCLSGSESGVVGHFLLNENSSTITDYSSTAINGVYVNGSPNFVIDSTACNDSLQMSKIVTVLTVGIEELSTENLSIYPNPVQNELFIELEKGQITEMIVFDYSGRIVKSITGSTSGKVDVSDLKQGIYVLKVSTRKGVFTNRFIKQ